MSDEMIGPLLSEREYQARELRNAGRGFIDALAQGYRPFMDAMARVAARLSKS